MKKVLNAVLTLLLAICAVPVVTVNAEDHPYSDTTYWADYCTTNGADVSACQGYVDYLSSVSEDSQKQLKELESQRSEIAANISAYTDQLNEITAQIEEQQKKIDEQQTKINNKQTEIDNKQVEIDNKQAQIDETQSQVTDLENKVKKRMVTQQPNMHFNKYLDILMGASSFQELLRIASGLVSITKYDDKTLTDLENMREQLSSEKKDLESAKKEMEKAKEELEEVKQGLVDAQNEMVIQKAKQQVIIDEANKKYAEIQAQSNQISSNIDSIQDTMQKMKNAGTLDTVVTTNGWTFPVPGAYLSAGTWAYPGGGIHLGADFAASVGTPVLAVGNGVVMNSANGCPTYGGLGSTCGSNIGGAAGGGNQLQALVSVNGSLYAVNYNHMMLNSPIATGTVITSGMQIGQVGSSGNSTGPHCHIEIYYLGDASNFSNYAATWNGDVSFGTSWYYNARKCDSGVGAPCRIRPETIFFGG